MTVKKDLFIYMVKSGDKKAKRIKLDKFIKAVNEDCFTKKFFINEKDVEKHITEERKAYAR
jgi:hypothetical protein